MREKPPYASTTTLLFLTFKKKLNFILRPIVTIETLIDIKKKKNINKLCILKNKKCVKIGDLTT